MGNSAVAVVVVAFGKALLRWFRACGEPCLSGQPAPPDEERAGDEESATAGMEFVVIDFNAWECAGSDVLWASVITKIFDTVGSRDWYVVCV